MRAIFEFASSRPDFVQPKIESIPFESKETKPIDLYFNPQPNYGMMEVYIFASDVD